MSVGAIYFTAAMLLIQQAVPDLTSGTFAQVERLGLTGALVLAVGVLWRSMSKKDEQLMSLTKQAAEALAFNTDTQKELRKIVEESTIAKRELKESVDGLRTGMAKIPCQAPDMWRSETHGSGGRGG